MTQKETHRVLSSNIAQIKSHLEDLRNKKISEENKEKQLNTVIDTLQSKHQETAEKLSQCQKSKEGIKQEMAKANASILNKTMEVQDLNSQKNYIDSKKADIAKDLYYYDTSLSLVNQEKNAIRDVHNDVDLHHQIYSNLHPEMLKGLKLRPDFNINYN